ncbi:MAG TPA: ECF-type sigma factor [Bryobacteraceae bacterium]|nr:ECF-type sigma factor [Bryobacteraceae bacterium]
MTITQILQDWNNGDPAALERLTPIVYDQLRQMASKQLRREQNVTLQPTELVHEAYLRLTESKTPSFRDRVHFYGAAAELMRRVLVDQSRRRAAAKRGATLVRVEMKDGAAIVVRDFEFDALDAALRNLAEFDARQARIVELRFFGGLSIAATADALGVSLVTVKRDWLVAKAWLLRELSK